MIENPAKRSKSGRPRNNAFIVPSSRGRQEKDQFNGALSHVKASMASDDRVRQETPILRDLYAFLEKDKAK